MKVVYEINRGILSVWFYHHAIEYCVYLYFFKNFFNDFFYFSSITASLNNIYIISK